MPRSPSTSFSSSLFSGAMVAAAEEARLWLGATSPNPPVGAVALDASGMILGVAAHKKAGGPHAEAALLQLCMQKGVLEDVETVCVTLEPCNHTGRTPPCSEALIQAGVKRVVIGTRDPNPFVNGGGRDRLEEAGIQVLSHVEENLCHQLAYAFHFKALRKLPWITVKQALTAKGSMIPPKGQKTFTSPASIRFAHRLRKRADALLTGSGTILADEPLFTVRAVPDFPDKKRILAILDKRRRVPEAYLEKARQNGFEVLLFSDLKEAIDALAERDVNEILVEGGPSLTSSVLESKLWAQHIAIKQTRADKPDRIEIEFSSRFPPPFDVDQFELEMTLPKETPVS